MANCIRNIPATDTTTDPRMWELSDSQWLVYYWLISHSNWNSFAQENHYFIYDNAFKKTKIMKKTGIKSRTTLDTAFKKLEEVGAISRDPMREAWQIIYQPLFIPMDVHIICFLMAFHGKINVAQTITLLAILGRMRKYEKSSPVDFTPTFIGKLMGKAKQNISRPDLILSLSVLEHSGIISLNKVTYENSLGVECIRYTLTTINLDGKNLMAFFADDCDELDDIKVEEYWRAMMAV